ncbi:MAG: hypothetical protein ABEJ81_05830 [Haloferacaceae archaeon]
MDPPEAVQRALNDESVAARVDLGGGDLLYVTPNRTLVYRSEGLLSDESVTEYPHGAERITVDRGRRKSTVTLDYGLDGERTLRLPTNRLEDALHPVLAGVLNGAGVTRPGETIKETFLLSELTVVVTSERLVRHVGAAVWDDEFEEYHYDDVTDLRFETGNVGTSVVVRLGDEQERFKVPNDRARAFRECLVAAVLAYHDYDSLDAFREARAAGETDDDEGRGAVDFGDGPAPLSADPTPIDDVAGSESPATAEESDGPDRGDEPESGTGPEVGETDAVPDPDAGAVPGTGMETDPEARADPEARTESKADPDSDAPVGANGGGTTANDDFAAAGFQPAGPVDEELAAEVVALREAVEEQNELLREQGRRIERQEKLFRKLIEELRRGR